MIHSYNKQLVRGIHWHILASVVWLVCQYFMSIWSYNIISCLEGADKLFHVMHYNPPPPPSWANMTINRNCRRDWAGLLIDTLVGLTFNLLHQNFIWVIASRTLYFYTICIWRTQTVLYTGWQGCVITGIIKERERDWECLRPAARRAQVGRQRPEQPVPPRPPVWWGAAERTVVKHHSLQSCWHHC